MCDLVREARRKYKEADGVVFDQDAALLKEIQCYKQQMYVLILTSEKIIEKIVGIEIDAYTYFLKLNILKSHCSALGTALVIQFIKKVQSSI